ncbi:MAG: hypothetical protein MUE51_13105 [Thermoleophilia bacterium]|jgi:xanthine/uracil permease|nr:hypothetical protein [Thermoleophilia bacterium]
MAVGWGGLAGAVGLMCATGRDWPVRLAIVAAGFAAAGLLAALRAPGRRALHAAGAWVAGWLIFGLWVALTALADALGGPGRADLVQGTDRQAVILAAWGLAFALLGAGVAWRWLRPAPRRRRY